MYVMATLKLNRLTGLLGSAVVFVGCQSQTLKIESEPAGADVLVSVQGQTAKKVGITPYVMQASEQGDRSQAMRLVVSKDGFGADSVLLPPSSVGRSGTVFMKLDQSKLPAACVNLEAALEKVSRGVADAQYQIKLKNLDQAERQLVQLVDEFQNVSVLHELLGNVYYLRKDIDKALASYRRSQAIAPNNSDTGRMIKRLEESRGGAR